MLPKKIYLNYVDEEDVVWGEDVTWSEEPISVADCEMLNKEYVDLSQIWHDKDEKPQANYKHIMYQTNYCSRFNVHIASIPTCLRSCKITARSWDEFVKEVNMRRWAYIEDLLPKGGDE